MPRRERILYFALAALFAISFTYRIREIKDRADLLLHPANHVRIPFGVDGFHIFGVESEAASAGLVLSSTCQPRPALAMVEMGVAGSPALERG